MWKAIRANIFLYIIFLAVVIIVASEMVKKSDTKQTVETISADSTWVSPSLYTDNATTGKERAMIMYGEDLIANTSKYLGPKGSVAHISNGMNCQNCHLDAGTRAWGNNYGAVYSTYPKLRDRSGSVENIYKRVNDCFERSLNGTALDTASKEMQAIYAYIKWLGKDVAKGKKPYGSGLEKLAYLNRAADPANGKIVYAAKCQSCHGANGEGQLNPSAGSMFAYPPLWGEHSYNDGAGLYRISNFASYAKNNMPFNQASKEHPQLSNEEAWDVAAFVNSQPRPHISAPQDWPNIAKKPFDHPFGPYVDGFTEQQHKYGPFQPIEAKRKELQKSK